ncbi:helix-turn-helix transcriptional regulator [Halobacteriovorax sp. JY17]|uniref:helix-turn-helix domain-containing protein n=1 Tax=Halobacteriovorax sp. JY17 TaxID=2014617 RepID=UPI000C360B6E|nr:helix-turn-helix transcriptional regulator [Halobacteriovorax sp. JY17]PIK15974.1 MAG: transcriptional regulator [Halobacteriovorax sp. JY17]
MSDKVSIINDSKKIASMIKEIRKQRKITQTELADYAGLSRAGIAKIESGASDIKLSTLISIANLLGLDLYLKGRGSERGE